MKKIATSLLANYQKRFAEKYVTEEEKYSQAIFVHQKIEILDQQTLFPTEKELGLGIIATLKHNDDVLNICNFHGLAYPGTKLDIPERLKQSEGIIQKLKTVKGQVIIGGDFNLNPNTQSIGMFEKAGYRNLISDYGILTTRDRISWEKYPDSRQKYADFAFVNSKVNVASFEVPYIEVSDHLPMILKIE